MSSSFLTSAAHTYALFEENKSGALKLPLPLARFKTFALFLAFKKINLIKNSLLLQTRSFVNCNQKISHFKIPHSLLKRNTEGESTVKAAAAIML